MPRKSTKTPATEEEQVALYQMSIEFEVASQLGSCRIRCVEIPWKKILKIIIIKYEKSCFEKFWKNNKKFQKMLNLVSKRILIWITCWMLQINHLNIKKVKITYKHMLLYAYGSRVANLSLYIFFKICQGIFTFLFYHALPWSLYFASFLKITVRINTSWDSENFFAVNLIRLFLTVHLIRLFLTVRSNLE